MLENVMQAQRGGLIYLWNDFENQQKWKIDGENRWYSSKSQSELPI